MYYVQQSWKATISRMLAYIFILGLSSCLLLYGAGMWLSITQGTSFNSIIAATFDYLIVMVGIAVFAAYNLWKFPNILISDKGIDLKVFFYTMHIDWKSIVRTQKRSNRLLIFVGSKGLFLNRLYGMFDAKVWDQPVVVFDSSEEMVNRLEEDIKGI